ncbi:hypothetical protein BD779DRAFT_623270 [Infundibulicybe gibba]|nr:hypothetical protein BD779DRAFT_623270 [Infundibulicybe gibba]
MWMGNEAVAAGLNLNPSRAVWNLDALKEDQPTESLSLAWRALEVYPFKQLSYKDLDSTHRQFHLASPRIIKPGQKIHASVAFAGTKYRPKAKFQKVGSENWDNILGRGGVGSLEWAHALGDLLELDLFDHSDIPTIMSDLNNGQPHTMVGCLEKLAFMARSDEGARAIETSDPKLGILFNLLNDRNSDANARIATYSVLEVLAYHGCRFTDDKISTLFNFLDDENSDAGMKIATHSILKELAHQDNFTDDQISTFFNLLNDKNGDASMKIATCSVLEVLACRSHRFTDDQLGALVNFLDDENSDADMKIVICNVLWELASKGRIFTDDQLSTLLNLLGDQGGNADVKLVTCYVLWSYFHR